MAKKKEIKKEESVRQPIVAVMGHVDHGKTTFLDSVRNARVAEKESGGITQNTRAHEVETKSGFKITFIDTPGHEAFGKMRERGAQVTDFVLLMVAADDGVQPQTKQSIEFAKQNGVPIIVAINKVDLEGTNLEKIKKELSSYDVLIEEYGGDVMCFEISAKNKIGLDELLEGIELMSEVNELKPHAPAEGIIAEAFVMESQLDKQIGYTALAILKSGSLDDRYFGVTQESTFKVRVYLNEENKPIKEIRESQPFVVTGLKEDLSTGEVIHFVKDEKTAKALQEKLKSEEVIEVEVNPNEGLDAAGIFEKMLMEQQTAKEGLEQKELNLIVKASSQGTLEAVVNELEKLETEESKTKILQKGTGPVTEKDLELAKVAKAIVISFQLEIPNKVVADARRIKVLVRKYEIIYDLVDEIADVLDSMDQPHEESIEMGKAKVLQVFTLSNGDQVAGSRVTEGKFMRGYSVKVMDRDEERGKTKIASVRQGKSEIKEIKKGSDCGLLLSPAVEGLEEGDEIVAFRIEKY